MADDRLTAAFNTFTGYVSARNISIMSKSEWEQLYFYCTAQLMFGDKPLVRLSAKELYQIGSRLQLDFSKVSSLVKKCYRFEYDEVKAMTFHELFKNNAILDLNVENGFVKFGIAYSLVQERIEEILSIEGIFSDSSFKKSVFQVPAYGMIRLLDGEIPSKNLLKKLRSVKNTIMSDIKALVKPDDDGSTKSAVQELEDMLNRKDLKSVASFIVVAAKAVSQPAKTISDIILPRITDNPRKTITEELDLDFPGTIA